MPFPSKVFLTVAIALWSTGLFGQTGNYFLSHYAPSEKGFNYACFDITQDKKGVMYFATKSGILEFNGRDWDLLEAESAIYSLQINSAGEIFWGGARGFGKIGLDKHGFQQIEILSDSTVSNVFQSMIVKNQFFFLTQDAVYHFDEASGKTIVIESDSPADTFLKLFELFGEIYISTDNGIYKLDQQKLVPANLNIDEEIVFFSRIDNNYVIGTGTNKIYACSEDRVFKPVELKDQAYIDASVIVNGSWLNRQLLAIGTLRGGVIFVNPISGVTQDFINYSTGLPDNEVFQLMTDANHNVWVAHDYGFSKIAPFIPLHTFSHYQGLYGNLICAHSAQNTVYVGTSLGLFKLEKEEVYDELVSYVSVEIRPSKKSSEKKSAALPQNEEQPEPAKIATKRGGVFNFLKRNRKPADDKTVSHAPQISPPTDNTPAAGRPRYRKEKKTERILRSSQYVFKKVNGIDAKVTHLIEVEGKLLAAGLSGLYEVNNLFARPILSEPIEYAFAPVNRDIVIVATYNNDVRTIRLEGKSIQNTSLFSNFNDQIHYAFEGTENELWLCGMDNIYRAQMKGSEVSHKQIIKLSKRNTDKTAGAVLNGNVVLAMSDGFYQINRTGNNIEKLDTLGRPSQYFAHNGNIVYRDEHSWSLLGNDAMANSLQLLNVFQDLRFITSDNGPNLWLISGGNELYKFLGDKVIPPVTEFPLFLKSIVTQDKKIIKLEEIIIDQEHSAVRFEVVQPDYINPRAVEFRYFLKGMDQDWSEWSSNNNIIPFPYLPTGEYTLQVQAKNIFGKISELEALSFEVLPPYWKRSWFYAMEFAVFGLLVMLSFRLSTRYRIISRLLSLLTIILLIEFIQTAIGATFVTKESPVIDFFIQVIVALLVLPVEGYLRNVMLRSLDSSGKFYQFMVPGKTTLVVKEKPEKLVKETSEIDD